MTDAAPAVPGPPAAPAPPARDPGIDAARFLLCLPVAILHNLPGIGSGTPPAWAALIADACRGAVPFYFVASGWFVRVPARPSPAAIVRPLRRLLPIYLPWVLIYAVVSALAGGGRVHIGVRDLLTGGAGFHLWFLPALGVALAAVVLGIGLIGEIATGVGCALLAAAGLALGSYHGILHLPAAPAQRLMEAPAFVFAGVALRRAGVRPGWRAGVLLMGLGWLAIAGEEWLIARATASALNSHDFVIGTFVLGTGTFLLARGLPAVRPLRVLAPLGAVSVGIYASHLLFLWWVQHRLAHSAPLGIVFTALIAFLLATGFVVVAERVPGLRRIVR